MWYQLCEFILFGQFIDIIKAINDFAGIINNNISFPDNPISEYKADNDDIVVIIKKLLTCLMC